MYKSQLQELCQRRKWRLPEYTASFEGPDHCRRFRATVAVEDLSFDSPGESMSSKEAQNQAARVALDHFNTAASPVPAALPPAAAAEGQVSYKTQLQLFAQKRKCEFPVYESTREGPDHCLRFKATVRVFGRTFESSQFFNSSRAAEHSAAGAALMSLASEEESASSSQECVEEDTGVYKGLLQQLAQKERFSPPSYTTLIGGLSHMPHFSSVVEVQGQRFEGGSAKTKRQAESNAAKVAWDHFQSMSSSSPAISKVKLTSSPPDSKIWRKIEKGIGNISDSKEVSYSDQVTQKASSSGVVSVKGCKPTIYQETSSNNDTSAVGVITELLSQKPDAEMPQGSGSFSLLSDKVVVYPRNPAVLLPEDAIELPFSNDKWVAVSMDFGSH